MKKLLGLAVTTAFLAAGAAALAGDCCGGSKCCDEDFKCSNPCPLAKTANKHRSFGNEGSAAKCKALACHVQANLGKI